MKKVLWLHFVMTVFMSSSFASETWDTLRFTNRAQCALDSKKPSTSAYILINNMDIARSLYRLAKSRGVDSQTLTLSGIKHFRKSVLSLLELIHQKIISKEIPLLPADLSEDKTSSRYNKIMATCRSDESCSELDFFIENIWKKKATYDLNFFNPLSFKKKNFTKKLSCRILKKFSPLESHLMTQKPSKETLLSVGNAFREYEHYYEECAKDNAPSNLKVANYQISIPIDRHFFWNKQGFDYWHSLKIYFSWAYRHSEEMKTLSAPFAFLFQSLEVEDSVILTATDCKSLTKPECESTFLNQSVLREFAKHDFKQKNKTLDIFKPLPEGTSKEIVKDPFPEINADILKINQSDSTDLWLDQFRENFSQTRSYMRYKLAHALDQFDIISSQFSPAELIDQIEKKYSSEVLNNLEEKEKKFKLNELYYLCSEFDLAFNHDLGVLKGKVDLLKKTNLLDLVERSHLFKRQDNIFSYFPQISKMVLNTCQNINQKVLFSPPFLVDRLGFHQWYLQKAFEQNLTSSALERRRESLNYHPPLLRFQETFSPKSLLEPLEEKEIICSSAIDCAREVLRSLVDIYAVTLYAETFFNIDRQIKSPQLFNPYAERTACKVYDPWFKLKSTLFNFMSATASAGLSLTHPGVVFASAQLDPSMVVSFEELAYNGKILYHPQTNPHKIKAGLALHFGKWLKIPCGLSISHTDKTNPYSILQFQGLTVRSCQSNEKTHIEVVNNSDVKIDPSQSTKCLVCSLNFESVSSFATPSIPLAGPSLYLARALFHLYKGLADPLNIPRSYKVEPRLVLETMNKYNGDIPKECIFPLTHGQECL